MKTLSTPFKQVSDLNEIIFAHRNKLYGAYELRTHYNNRLLKAFIIAVASKLLLVLIAFVMNDKAPEVNGNFSTADPRAITPCTFEVNVQETSPKEHSITDERSTLTVNDAASEQKEKHGSVNVETITFNDDDSRKQEIAFDLVSSGKNADPPFMLFSQVIPSFPGGTKAFSRYIQKHFDCSPENISGEGKIILRFVVLKDGSVANVEVLRANVGIDCVNKAKNLLLNSPKWNPGFQSSNPINTSMILPILIRKDSIQSNKGRSCVPQISDPLSDSVPRNLNRTQPIVYPNPFTESFSILYYENSSQQIDVELFDMTGRKITSFDYMMQTGKNYLPIELLQHAVDGVYFVRVRFDDHTDLLRVVKAQK